jgi:hypothetical protein
MRAVAEGNPLDRHFFIIMDRLYDTLDVRMKQWKERRSKCKGNLFGIGADKTQLYQLTVERLTVAYDLAAALSYMHANKLVYRDLKQQNIGFDVVSRVNAHYGPITGFSHILSTLLLNASEAT